MRPKAALLALALVGCDADVRAEVDEAAGPMPGCVALVPREELLVIPGSTMGQLMALDGVDVGVLFSQSPDSMRSRRILDAFGAWPPALGAEAKHVDESDSPRVTSSRSDGVFAFTTGFAGPLVGQVGVPGVYPAHDGQPILEAAPGTGVYWQTEGSLRYHRTPDAVEPSFELSFLSPAPEHRLHGFDGEGHVILRGREQFWRLDGDVLEPFGPLPPGDDGSSPGWIVPGRDGDVWYARHESPELALFEAGAEVNPVPTPFVSETLFWGGRVAVSAWAESWAIVVLAQQWTPEGGTTLDVRLAVTDGVQATTTTFHEWELAPFSVVSSPSGDVVLVSYKTGASPDGVVVRRFDCVSP
jgi:hypothetical protein